MYCYNNECEILYAVLVIFKFLYISLYVVRGRSSNVKEGLGNIGKVSRSLAASFRNVGKFTRNLLISHMFSEFGNLPKLQEHFFNFPRPFPNYHSDFVEV